MLHFKEDLKQQTSRYGRIGMLSSLVNTGRSIQSDLEKAPDVAEKVTEKTYTMPEMEKILNKTLDCMKQNYYSDLRSSINAKRATPMLSEEEKKEKKR